jgi:hypothetical protein
VASGTLDYVEACSKRFCVESDQRLRPIPRSGRSKARSEANAQVFLLVDNNGGARCEFVNRQVEIPIDRAPLAVATREFQVQIAHARRHSKHRKSAPFGKAVTDSRFDTIAGGRVKIDENGLRIERDHVRRQRAPFDEHGNQTISLLHAVIQPFLKFTPPIFVLSNRPTTRRQVLAVDVWW